VPLLDSLATQEWIPCEVVVVDGSRPDDMSTEWALQQRRRAGLPFRLEHLRSIRGAAVQRNAGLERAQGDLIACIDDDMRLHPRHLAEIVKVFESDASRQVGGVEGYVDNQYTPVETQARWRWYRRLRLFSTYEPGRFDWKVGYPINPYLAPPFDGTREVDFLSGNNAVWRREVFASGLRFSAFFDGGGPLEDVHFSLSVGREWRLLQCGSAHCIHVRAPSGRPGAYLAGHRWVRNSWFIYRDLQADQSLASAARFWYVQIVLMAYLAVSGVRHRSRHKFVELAGRLRAILGLALAPLPPAPRLHGGLRQGRPHVDGRGEEP